jgi:hypothetical protein
MNTTSVAKKKLALIWMHELNLGHINFEFDFFKKIVDNFYTSICKKKKKSKYGVIEFGAMIKQCQYIFLNVYDNFGMEFI